MADVKISELTAGTDATGTEILAAVQGTNTVKLTRNQLLHNLVDPVTPQDASSKAYVDAQIAAISNQGAGFTGVITGCGVVWTGGLNFTVAAGTYAINGNSYSIAQTNLTLSTADPTNDRFDVIALNSGSFAEVIQGIPANPALIPTVDPATQLYLTAISVPANSTTPGNITNVVLYAENSGGPTEWNSSSSGSTWNLASITNPHSGSKCIEASALTNSGYIQLQKDTGTFDLSTINNLVFYIRSKATWNSNRSLTIEFLNANVLVGNALTFRDGSYGFVTSNTTSYQQIVIPISAFNIGTTVVNQIRFIAAGSGGQAIGFYLDDVSLQAGVSVTSQNFMVWRATWSSTTAYVKNDVVTDNGRPWVAVLPNTNSRPADSNPNWQSISKSVQVDSYVTPQSATSWAKPSGATYIEIYCIGGGGSGAGGRTNATAAAGGAGGGGAFAYICDLASNFDTTLKITVGAGGAQTTANANGVTGNDGNPSFVKNNAASVTYITAGQGLKGDCGSGITVGGGGGNSGPNATVMPVGNNILSSWGIGLRGAGGNSTGTSNAGGNSCIGLGGAGGAGGSSSGQPGGSATFGGGGGGGGVSGVAANGIGGSGGGACNAGTMLGGSAGATVSGLRIRGGAGGCGGNTTTSFDGGAGGSPGGGGGGGAGGGGGTPGKGGAGGDGAVVIITYF